MTPAAHENAGSPDTGLPDDTLPSGGPSGPGRGSGSGSGSGSGARPGDVLGGRYHLQQLIGRGGMGEVFRATDTQLEREVAIKVLSLPADSPLDLGEQLDREAKILANLRHPNIVPVYEMAADGERSYFVMELVRGATLDAVLNQVHATRPAGDTRPREIGALLDAVGLPLPAGRRSVVDTAEEWCQGVARIMLETAGAVEAAHAKGIVHRDLKPHNLMLRGDASPVVLDFGLAGARTRDTADISDRLVGSAAYLAPEQVTHQRAGNDPRSDVYQLGLVLYELLTLRRAFSGADLDAVLEEIKRGRFARPRALDRSIPADLESICLRAMELEPQRRYPSARELREDLQRFVEGDEPPLAARGGVFFSMWRSTRYALRRRRVAAAALLALVLGVVGGAMAWREVIGTPAPEELRWFRWRGESEELQYAPAFNAVARGDVIGFSVRSTGTRWVYALSVFGERDPPTWVNPLDVQAVGPTGGSAASDDDTWGLRIEKGEHDVRCARVTDGGPENPFEGLLVLVSHEPQPHLEEWLQLLQLTQAERGGAGVDYPLAQRSLDRALRGRGVTRGESVSMDSDELGRLRSRLSASAIFGDSGWEVDDPRRYEFFVPVEGE